MNTARELLICLLAGWALSAITAETAAQTTRPKAPPAAKVTVEDSEPLPIPSGGVLGTTAYRPTKTEARFLVRDATRGINATYADERAYDLTGKAGKYISWFGIVRAVELDKKTNRTVLLLEMKYFDGLTDLHIQVVSYHGGGDFKAAIEGTGHSVRHLDLVRIYGKVVPATDGPPLVKAEYVRRWAWGRFTFMTYGVDRSNPKWKKLRKVKALDAYDSAPGIEFYEKRLGPRNEYTADEYYMKGDFKKAADLYRQAAAKGDAKAQLALGLMYGSGRGVKADHVEAVKWFRKSAAQGYPNAQFFLGMSYLRGNGVKKDTAEGIKWIRKSADAGYAPAQNILGMHYEMGIGVEKDENKALEWYTKSAAQGYTPARRDLAELKEKMKTRQK